ncbi:hypothetical protein AB205_0042040 [Aquarana catesbeiana]|uniref:Cadherin domain-containing protein n=1 Tax=Aquarana catesbeiana TaxID=8400 RepID=A0A2G9SI42_AQUCT|nr:hypothetical protein AB205_0042040 [Aquarana catesbeiana]
MQLMIVQTADMSLPMQSGVNDVSGSRADENPYTSFKNRTVRERRGLPEVPERSSGTSVIQVTAIDADDPSYGNSAKIVYSIIQGQPYFSVDADTGIIKTALPDMSRENREHYQVVIQAKDMGGQMGGLSGTTTVNITLTDVNDNPPRFPQSSFRCTLCRGHTTLTVNTAAVCSTNRIRRTPPIFFRSTLLSYMF